VTPGDQIKFIVDAQLPRGLCGVLDEAGYDAIHTINLPEQNRTPDQAINALSIAPPGSLPRRALPIDRPRPLKPVPRQGTSRPLYRGEQPGTSRPVLSQSVT
jgi:hypothetical protein